ncbi:alpha/beta hydrolase family protein [Bradyrhizobium prioriisuperbiae]|uniref:alpha/beta hydrolase family protein n=1 Tax=Bradyrhizobium prioriisuperbiae TaxID=2854389 RepID=UPI0028E2CB21|nr:alpha/beta hydrolase [Bradyrhizobium prioritasuperba]
MRGKKFLKIAGAVVGAAFIFAILSALSAGAQARFGAQSAETEPARRQQWTVPSPDTATVSHALLYRPPGDGPFRLAVIAHASTQNALRRAQMPQPEYAALALQLVARGFAVLVPERLGHGATGGPYLEDQGAGCDDTDYVTAGRVVAAAIRAAMLFLQTQPFVRKDSAIVIGHSAGGFGALALASSDPKAVSHIVAFAPGRGGHAGDRRFAVCAEARLVTAAGEFGQGARVPVTWLVAENDSYFSPELSQRMAEAFRSRGGQVDFRVLRASGDEGHWLAEREVGSDMAAILDRAIRPSRIQTR